MTHSRKIYLDNNATTEIDPVVKKAYFDAIENSLGNPSSLHFYGQEQKKLLTAARYQIASYFSVKPSEIYFTSGATESINMILRGILDLFANAEVISSTTEHAAVINTLEALKKKGARIKLLEPGIFGAVTPDAVLKAITPETKLIVLMAANNETGVKTDIEAIAKMASSKGILFFVDGVVLLGKEPFTIPEGVSAMSFSGHKFHAPKGVGFSLIRKSVKFTPLITGGEQEFGKRCGTENVAGIVAMAEAIRQVEKCLPEAEAEMRRLRDRFESKILEKCPSAKINGTGPRIANTSNIAFPGVEGETLLATLSLNGIAASHGSACASGALEPSRVLLGMGLSKEIAMSSLRFSLSRFTTEEEIDQAAEIILSLVS